MNEEVAFRDCPICRKNTIVAGEEICPRCRYVLDRMFPEGWAGMDFEDLREHYIVGGDDYAWEYEEAHSGPEMLEEYHPELEHQQPEEQGFIDRNWKKMLAAAIVLGVICLLLLIHVLS